MTRFLQVVLKISLFGYWPKRLNTRQRLNRIRKSTKGFLKDSERAKEALNEVYWQLLLFSSNENDIPTQRGINKGRVSFNPERI
jgi:hypothetical protein